MNDSSQQFIPGSRDTFSPHPSEIESLEGFEDEGVMEEGVGAGDGMVSTDLDRSLNFVGATIRDASYPGDGLGRMMLEMLACGGWAMGRA